MKMSSVGSSNLREVGYERSSKEGGVLRVVFQNGAAYSYTDVPFEVYQGLMGTESKGAYFAENIKKVYKFEKEVDAV